MKILEKSLPLWAVALLCIVIVLLNRAIEVVMSNSVTSFTKKIIFWDEIEKAGAEVYDEAFLASLRLEIKGLGDSQVLIVPNRFSGNGAFWGCSDSELMNEKSETELFETFTASFLHLARRIKDCKNVVGFAFPDFDTDWDVLKHYQSEHKENFAAAFQKKHSHYLFIEK